MSSIVEDGSPNLQLKETPVSIATTDRDNMREKKRIKLTSEVDNNEEICVVKAAGDTIKSQISSEESVGSLRVLDNQEQMCSKENEISERRSIVGGIEEMPEDIGMNVFGKLEASDKPSFFRAFPQIRSRLEKTRTSLLIQEIAPILVEAIPRESFLECRKTCQSWKAILDNCYQTHEQHVRLEFENEGEPNIPDLTNSFQSSEQILQFLQDMESHPGNPFPGRKLRLENSDAINISTLRVQVEYSRSVINLMNIFGLQVHFVDIFLNNVGERENYKTTLRNLLMQMPNLKRFRVIGGYGFESVQELLDFYRTNPLPELLQLETVDLPFQERPGRKLHFLENYCSSPNVKRLGVHSFLPTPLEDTVFRFSNLQVMNIHISLNDLERFCTLERPPPLEKVSLGLFNHEVPHTTDVDLQRVFEGLKIFASTLKIVIITPSYVSPASVINPGFQICLPKLERLKLDSFDSFPSLNSFLKLKSLKLLELEVRSEGEFEVLNSDFEELLQQSGIWDRLANLNTCKFIVGSVTKIYYRR